MHRTLALIPRVGVVLLCSGCATIQQLEFAEPSLTLESVQLTELGLNGGAFDLLVDLYNPNPFGFQMAQIAIAMDLEDTHFGDVAIDQPMSVPSRQHATVRVPLRFTWAGVGAGARGLLTRGAVGYGLDSRLMLETPLGRRSVSLRSDGEVQLNKTGGW